DNDAGAIGWRSAERRPGDPVNGAETAPRGPGDHCPAHQDPDPRGRWRIDAKGSARTVSVERPEYAPDEAPPPPTILLVSTADTDLLAARAASALPSISQPRAEYRVANPARVAGADIPALLDGVRVAIVRLLGGARVWEDGLAALARAGIPTIALGGEATPDADLMALSSVPLSVAAAASGYLLAGGPENLA